jgi:tRNA1(Val) A37 N6-methylase TrmN6
MSQTEKAPEFPDTTCDLFLGDRLEIHQPAKGYRAGVDAVLLAACVRPKSNAATLLDVGAGAGTIGLCAAHRLPGLSVVLLEREAALSAISRRNIAVNHLGGRVRAVQASVTSSAADLNEAGITPESFDICLANPPFHDEDAGTAAGNALKAVSHAMPADALEDWARFMARMTAPGGQALMIHKAEALPRLLAALSPRFGRLRILPIHARPEASAIRVIIAGVKGSRAPLEIRPGFVLHGEGNSFTPAASAILRHGAALEI